MSHPTHGDFESLKYSLYVAGALVGLIAFAFAGWNVWIKGKVNSITKLWEKFTEHVESYNDDRLADAKEFATKSEVGIALTRIEAKIESSETKLENAIRDLGTRIDKAMNR